VSIDHLPAKIEKGVQDCAAAWHVTHDEAIIKLLETGLIVLQPKIASPTKKPRLARDAARKAKLEALPNIPPERANAAFGAFADVPGFQESIEAVIGRRAQRYGFPE